MIATSMSPTRMVTSFSPDLSHISRSERSILERALSPQPERRWENCDVFVRELHYAWLYATGGQASPSSIVVTASTSSSAQVAALP